MVITDEDSESDSDAAIVSFGITGNFIILVKLFLGSHIRTHTLCYNI